MNPTDGAGVASKHVAVLVEPRMLADMLSMLLIEGGMGVVAIDHDAIDVVVVSKARLGDIRAANASATVVLTDDDSPSTAAPSMGLTELLEAVKGRAPA